MKKMKKWLALILAVALVASNAIYSMGSGLEADEIGQQEVITTEQPDEVIDEAEGVDVEVVDEPQSALEPVVPPVPEPVVEQPAAEPQTKEEKYNVIIQKPDVNGGVIKVWTTGDKADVVYDGNNQYKEELTEATTFNFEITANEYYEVERVTDQNGTEIALAKVNGKAYTYQLSSVTEDKTIFVSYKEVKNDEVKVEVEEKDDREEYKGGKWTIISGEDKINLTKTTGNINNMKAEVMGVMPTKGIPAVVRYEYGNSKYIEYFVNVKSPLTITGPSHEMKGDDFEGEYTITYQMEESLRGRYVYNGGAITGSPTEDPVDKRDGRFGYSFGVFLKQKETNINIFAVQMVLLEDVEGRVVKSQTELTDTPIKFKAGEVVSILSNIGNASAIGTFADTQFKKGTNVKLEVRAVKHQVTFVGDGGKVIDTQTVVDGTSAIAPDEDKLAVEHKKFTGWDVNFSNVTGNLKVTAQYEWTDLAVNYYLDEPLKGAYTLKNNGQDTYTEWMTAPNKIAAFGVWLKRTSDDSTADRRVTMVMRDTVTGKNGNGSPATIQAGTVVSKLHGQDAKVIYASGNLGGVTFAPGTQIHIIVKAAPDESEIRFETNGGTAVDTIQGYVEESTGLSAWPETTMTGYDLEGWYEDEELTQKAESPPTTFPEKATTYYAKWKRAIDKNTFGITGFDTVYDGKSHTVTFTGENNLLDGETVEYSVNGTDGWSVEKPSYTNVDETNGETGAQIYARVVSGGDVLWDGSADVKIQKRALTITVGDYEKVYGETDPTYESELEGWLEEVPFEYTLEREQQSENVGKYEINIVKSELNSGNYEEPIVKEGGTLTITAKPVTLIPVDKSKVYGETDPTFGFEVFDDKNVLDEKAGKELSYSVAPVAKDNEEVKNVGSYELRATKKKDNANYNVSVVHSESTFEITKRPVTLTANSTEKLYGTADKDVQFSATVTPDAVVEGDTLDYSVERTQENQGEDARTYRLDVICDAKKNPNYNITVVSGELEILPAEIEVLIKADAVGKAYGTIGDPELTATVKGVDPENINYRVTRVEGENAGEYTINVVLGDNPNYNEEKIKVTDGIFTISPKEIDVTVGDAEKTYGDSDPIKDYNAATDGLMKGDSELAYVFSREQGDNVGKYEISAVLDGSVKNYVIGSVDTGELTINKKEVTVTPTSVTKTYGEQDPAFTAKAEGVLKGEEGSLSYTLSREDESNQDVGIYNIKVDEVTPSNYKIKQGAGTLTIKQAKAKITAVGASKIYGGQDPEELTANISGLVNGDEILTYSVIREEGEQVKTDGYGINIELEKEKNPNYDVEVDTSDAKFTILKKAINVQADAKTKTYGDNLDSEELTATVDLKALVGEDKATDIQYAVKRADDGEDVSDVHVINVHPGKNTNYIVVPIPGNLTITPRAVSVTADDVSKIYGAADPDLTAKTKGAVGNDVLDYTISREENEEVGSYDIEVNAGENPNYKVETAKGNFKILGQVFYNANGGNGEVADEAAYERDGSITMKGQSDITHGSATFLGWSQQQYDVITTQEEEDSAKATIPDNISMGDKSVTLHAVWALDENGPEGAQDKVADYTEFTVTYDANGGSGTVVDGNIYPEGYEYTVAENTFANEGYVFDRWNLEADGSGNGYEEKQIMSVESETVLFAQWNPQEQAATTPTTIVATIAEPLTALANAVGEVLNANVQELVAVDEDGVPLADRASGEHKCCVLHLLLLLLALGVEIGYIRGAKRRQRRSFELEEEIALLDKELNQKVNKDKAGIA